MQLFTKNFVTFFVKIKPVKPDFTGLYQTVIGQERVSFTLEISVNYSNLEPNTNIIRIIYIWCTKFEGVIMHLRANWAHVILLYRVIYVLCRVCSIYSRKVEKKRSHATTSTYKEMFG